jgi:prophage DNA circulation protein
MSSTSESSHAKNVANFESLISFCITYGTIYNPSKNALTLPQLKALHTAAIHCLQNTKTYKTAFDNATNMRVIAFKDLKPFATKLINALAASGAGKLVVQDARIVNRKIRGDKAKKITTTTANAAESSKAISTSQLSYDNKIEHLAALMEIVTQQPSYKPNEAELKVAALKTKLNNLKKTNTNLKNAYTNWSNARIQRDVVLYHSTNGLVQTAAEVKKYLKSVYGTSSQQFKQASAISFETITAR